MEEFMLHIQCQLNRKYLPPTSTQLIYIPTPLTRHPDSMIPIGIVT